MRFAHRGQVFLETGVDIADAAADLAEGTAGAAGEPRCGHEHHWRYRQRDDGQWKALAQHGVRDQQDQQRALDHADQWKGDRLLDGVGVVGDAAHHVAGFVSRVVAERQTVNVGEDFDPHASEDVLAGVRHQEELQASEQ